MSSSELADGDHVQLDIEGVQVMFPFRPYKVQVDYMSALMRALKNGGDALLESPTGTGKTMSLLCATLAHQKHMAATAPRGRSSAPRTIIYASRTHSQLAQVVSELKRTAYAASTHLAVLGSREQLCLHHTYSKLRGTALSHACGKATRLRSCGHYNNTDPKAPAIPIMDIEELVDHGKARRSCPYYTVRYAAESAQLVLMPYNYLLDPETRRGLRVQWSESVVVFDEAHNLETAAAEAASFDLRLLDCYAAFDEAQRVIRAVESKKPCTLPMDAQVPLATLQLVVSFLTEFIGSLGVYKPHEGSGKQLDGLTILLCVSLSVQKSHLFREGAELREDADGDAVSMLRRIRGELAATHDMYMDMCVAQHNGPAPQVTAKLILLVKAIQCLLRVDESEVLDGATNLTRYWSEWKRRMEYYTVWLAKEDRAAEKDSVTAGSAVVFHFWCMSPSIAVAELKPLGVKSFIVTSGTLSPMQSFASEMRVNFTEMLENPHVIAGDQVMVTVCPMGPQQKRLCSVHGSKGDLSYIDDLGCSFVNFFRMIPGGILVFFPTYSWMNTCMERWKSQQCGLWSRMEASKHLMSEPRQAANLQASLKEFDGVVQSEGGAVFFAVCRGKLSEGMDFSDDRARCVIITGIPYAPIMDPMVKLKKQFLNSRRQRGQGELSGEAWYMQSAARAVNQAVGRIVRHRSDYGAVILCDERFGRPSQMDQLSSWIRPYVRPRSSFREALSDVVGFFKAASANPLLKQTSSRAVKAPRRIRAAPQAPSRSILALTSQAPTEQDRARKEAQLAKVRARLAAERASQAAAAAAVPAKSTAAAAANNALLGEALQDQGLSSLKARLSSSRPTSHGGGSLQAVTLAKRSGPSLGPSFFERLYADGGLDAVGNGPELPKRKVRGIGVMDSLGYGPAVLPTASFDEPSKEDREKSRLFLNDVKEELSHGDARAFSDALKALTRHTLEGQGGKGDLDQAAVYIRRLVELVRGTRPSLRLTARVETIVPSEFISKYREIIAQPAAKRLR
jgi:regulator of telomere elongation helicase 1